MDLAKALGTLGFTKDLREMSVGEMRELIELLDEMDKRQRYSGLANWFQPGPYSIENLPKHAAFFDATREFRELLLLGGNRCIREGTLVATPAGPVEIQNLKVGDTVYDWKGEPTKVARVWDNGVAPVIDFHIGDCQVSCTPNHKFMARRDLGGNPRLCRTPGHPITAAELLLPHSEVAARNEDGQLVWKRIGRSTAYYLARVYDITVEQEDNYFLLANGLVSKNSGKTQAGAYICTVLATGLYPEWWTGLRYDGPVNIWAVGKTAQTTRDTVQRAFLGDVGSWGTGVIPKHLIVKTTALSGTANAVDVITVQHTSGLLSTIGLKSYKQEVSSFYGTARHFTWLDEPAPELIYNESLLRTAVLDKNPLAGPKGGRQIHTITPKEGLTRLLADFLADCELLAGTEKLKGLDTAIALMQQEDAQKGDDEAPKIITPGTHRRAAIAIGWDDVPWLDEKTKSDILASTPPHLRDTVSRGVPSIGFGAVYPIPLDDVVLDAHEVKPIPAHWRRLYGMDVGNLVTAAVFLAHDPDNDIVYVVGEHYVKNQPKEVHAAAIQAVAGDWMPGMIDPASRIPSQTDQANLLREYRRLGLKIWPGKNSQHEGIQRVWSRLATGKLKFYPHTQNLQNEYILYHYDDNLSNPKPVKQNDHALDALRYAVMGLEHGVCAPIAEQHIIRPGGHGGKRYNI